MAKKRTVTVSPPQAGTEGLSVTLSVLPGGIIQAAIRHEDPETGLVSSATLTQDDITGSDLKMVREAIMALLALAHPKMGF